MKRRIAMASPDPLAFLGAAYALTREAYVAIGGTARRRTALLWPKSGKGSDLAKEFRREYDALVVRWAAAKQGQAARLAVLQRMLELADSPRVAGGPAPELAPEQKAEIERLLAEAAGEPRDPLGIATPWSELRRRSGA